MFRPRLLYIQIWPDRIKVSEALSGKIYDEQPLVAIKQRKSIEAIGNIASSFKNQPDYSVVNPFLHPRLLLADFSVASKLLMHITKTLIGSRLLPLAPNMIIHPMAKLDGGLTEVEYKALKKLAFSVGAKKVAVYEGQELSLEQINNHSINFNISKNTNPLAIGKTVKYIAISTAIAIFILVKNGEFN